MSAALQKIMYQEALAALTSMQKIFVEVFHGNATEACRIAGYKECEVQGHANIRHPKIIKALKLRPVSKTGKHIKKKILDRDARQQFWSSVLLNEDTPMRERLRASELLGRSCGDFLDRVEINVNHTITVAQAIEQADVQSVTTIEQVDGSDVATIEQDDVPFVASVEPASIPFASSFADVMQQARGIEQASAPGVQSVTPDQGIINIDQLTTPG